MEIKVIGIKNIPLIKKGDDLSQLILKSADSQNIKLDDGDILVIAETAVAKADGNVINLKILNPENKLIILLNLLEKKQNLLKQ